MLATFGALWHSGTTVTGTPRFPPRYEPVSRLGKGGGGEVWAVRDRADGAVLAMKFLAEGAEQRETAALVREASALSGLEGLGVPRVLRFGRLPGSDRPYLLRELVEGQSLLDALAAGLSSPAALSAVADAADKLSGLHRAALLHGDVKPANVIVEPGGGATLVDLGLAAPLREAGQAPVGLTPRYAAPELFAGEPLGVRAEVYSLGVTLSEVCDRVAHELSAAQQAALAGVVARATRAEPHERYPSVDELAVSLRRAARLPHREPVRAPDAAWTVRGIDGFVQALLDRLGTLGGGEGLLLQGPAGSGKTAILRRLSWLLGVSAAKVSWVEARGAGAAGAVAAELSDACAESVLIIDDFAELSTACLAQISAARALGARLVASGEEGDVLSALQLSPVALPRLEGAVAQGLVSQAIPSLSASVVAAICQRADGRPGVLRSLVRRIGAAPVVSVADVARVLDDRAPTAALAPVASAARELDQGRVREASRLAESFVRDTSFDAQLVRARIALGRGEADTSIALLRACAPQADDERAIWQLHLGRALLRKGSYAEALAACEAGLATGPDDALAAELATSRGVAESFLGQHERAIDTLTGSVARAAAAGDDRVLGLAEGSLALALQRTERLAEAKLAYERALAAAERASDAGTVTTMRLNLAALATHGQGEIAEALSHLEAAVDMGRRAGRDASVRQALLNLANLDLYLGRLARAAASIETLGAERDALSRAGGQQAQLLGLEAELSSRTGSARRSALLYEKCARAYDELGRGQDAAEARIEAVLLASRQDDAKASELSVLLDRAAKDLGEGQSHRSALLLARAALAILSRDDEGARSLLVAALAAATEAGQREWVWRALDARSRLESEAGRTLAARRDAEQALSVLEDIGARLPRDLREVYWNDPRRRSIRAAVAGESIHALLPDRRGITQLTGQTRLLADDRLARILEVNRELATLRALPEILERVIQLATDLVQAERGYVLLTSDHGLTVHAVRQQAGDEDRQRFSRSIAERAIDTGEPVVSLSARDDAQMAAFASVHTLALESVACVPIRSPRGRAIGALYVETRSRRGTLFEREVLTLRAFADQAAIAIETARLLEENAARATALAAANTELLAAREELADALDHRTHQLAVARKDLQDTKAVLRGHFGYQGLVGVSPAMRTVYAIIDRVKGADIPLLITGESGTGKEVVARAIHQGGPRAKQPFLGINCAAIPDNLLESELFGHLRGAFTGADKDRKGLFRECEGGTLLLDEIGEMPLKMQAGLLRVLQERTVRPLGGTREEPVNVRIIAATHRDLEEMVNAGTFREDLYYRLRVVELRLPALRERLEDIPALVDHFLGIFAARYRREKGVVRRDALRLLARHPFPGNVRQLENTLLNAWILAESHDLSAESFDLALPRSRTVDAPPAPPASTRPKDPAVATVAERKQEEKERILEALRLENWNRLRAAERLGLPRRTFYRRLKDYGIQ